MLVAVPFRQRPLAAAYPGSAERPVPPQIVVVWLSKLVCAALLLANCTAVILAPTFCCHSLRRPKRRRCSSCRSLAVQSERSVLVAHQALIDECHLKVSGRSQRTAHIVESTSDASSVDDRLNVCCSSRRTCAPDALRSFGRTGLEVLVDPTKHTSLSRVAARLSGPLLHTLDWLNPWQSSSPLISSRSPTRPR